MSSFPTKSTVHPFSVAVLLAAIVVASVPAEAGKGRAKASRASLRTPEARIGLDIDMHDALIVRMGYRLAIQKIKEVATCGALFAELDSDGLSALGSTHYSSARPGPERALCNRGILAVARAGGREIRLCPRLRSLVQEGVAAILIHEALHTAGLGEYPVDPEAPTSAEITRTVLDACSLG